MNQKDVIANLDSLFGKSKKENKQKNKNFKLKQQNKDKSSDKSKIKQEYSKQKYRNSNTNDKKYNSEKSQIKIVSAAKNQTDLSNLSKTKQNSVKIISNTQITNNKDIKITSTTSVTKSSSNNPLELSISSPPLKKIKGNSNPHINEITSDSDKEFVDYINSKLPSSLYHKINPEINTNINSSDLISIIMNTKNHNPSKQVYI